MEMISTPVFPKSNFGRDSMRRQAIQNPMTPLVVRLLRTNHVRGLKTSQFGHWSN
jgi:hypothetical protein